MANTTTAAIGYGVAGGSKVGTSVTGNASILASGQSEILLGSDGNPALVTNLSTLAYARIGASLADHGSASLKDGNTVVDIKWGVYSGGTIVDLSGVRTADYFQFIAAQSTPSAVQANLSGSYTSVIGQNKFITETGKLGGGLSSVGIGITAGRLTSYSLGLSDGLSRDWSASCANCSGGVPLSTFANSGISLSGTGPGPGVTGTASGFPVGPSGAGVVSSFALRSTDGKGVTGSFAVK